MSEIKIVSIDIDGTLINDERQIPADVKATIHRALEQGVKIVITTGRPLPGVQNILDELGIEGSDQYVITHNGGLMQTADGSRILFHASLDLAEYKELNSFMSEQNTYIQVEDQLAAYTTNHLIHRWASYENALVNLPLHVVNDDDKLQNIEIIKGIANAESDELDDVQAKVPASILDKMSVIRSTANNLEFINKNASKGNALSALAEVLNIDIKNTMAIGDQENDFSMIERAGLGVAMGNAIEKIKQVADVETDTNNNSGVARALEDYVL
ncbi:sugar phosphate phosphatase [Leuconostoc litchii]|uniref:HAD family phosphatase n=1 Tax=Leuconostoc litchii TaxID=1981069 RepID=A0A6P2CLZ1_9LACO|nr:Cof-type HAD-IIB family hydrolase [Leuconostoc litchii]TYC46306.1 HAD family phosphatase [Leuconostoc litchii]GMA70025.1 sugar phosphate phosphatase [Leuconostoc litchii]